MTTQEFINKINNKDDNFDFNSYNGSLELQEIVFEGFSDKKNYKWIDSIQGDFHRWDQEMLEIYQINDKYYAIPWRRAATEMQESSFYDKPFEVRQEAYTAYRYVPVI